MDSFLTGQTYLVTRCLAQPPYLQRGFLTPSILSPSSNVQQRSLHNVTFLIHTMVWYYLDETTSSSCSIKTNALRKPNKRRLEESSCVAEA
ncbi:hypothetical protein FRC03_010363 [Tulasnella sp. 419]|nr:hypothetical protein FRC03_010363 [Tulasnella sp. 419]